MFNQRRLWALASITSVVLLGALAAGCGDDDDDGDATVESETPAAVASPTVAEAETPEAEATTADETPAGDETATTGGATVEAGAASLVDARGFTLYTFANDTAGSGTSACTGGCATAWPALTATGEPTAGEGVSGELGTITREDGTTQVTYDGLPLYFFASDAAPGDTNGASIPNWALAQP
jgi:predicted lipoprotein with Yx(FWY)xxD motif